MGYPRVVWLRLAVGSGQLCEVRPGFYRHFPGGHDADGVVLRWRLPGGGGRFCALALATEGAGDLRGAVGRVFAPALRRKTVCKRLFMDRWRATAGCGRAGDLLGVWRDLGRGAGSCRFSTASGRDLLPLVSVDVR